MVVMVVLVPEEVVLVDEAGPNVEGVFFEELEEADHDDDTFAPGAEDAAVVKGVIVVGVVVGGGGEASIRV